MAYLTLLQQTPLFKGFSLPELETLLPTLSPQTHPYKKGTTLLIAGDETQNIGVVLSGQIEASKHTRSGNLFTVSRLGPGGVFGDVLSGSHTKSPVTVTARTNCNVLLFSYNKITAGDSTHALLQRRLLANLVAVISDKYFSLDRRIDLLLVPGLRRRIASYLLGVAKKEGSLSFTIPYNRTSLAGYLGCERSALSREISRMAADGLLVTNRSHFQLTGLEPLQQLL